MENQDSNLMLLLGRIDGKLDAALHRINKFETAHNSLADRVNNLEKMKARLLGFSLGSGLFGAGAIKVIPTIFG